MDDSCGARVTMDDTVKPPPEPRPCSAELTALRARRDAIQGEAHQLKIRVRALSASLLGGKRRERDALNAEIAALKERRAQLEEQAEHLSAQVSAMLRAL